MQRAYAFFQHDDTEEDLEEKKSSMGVLSLEKTCNVPRPEDYEDNDFSSTDIIPNDYNYINYLMNVFRGKSTKLVFKCL